MAEYLSKIISARFPSIFYPDLKARLSARIRCGREPSSRAVEKLRKLCSEDIHFHEKRELPPFHIEKGQFRSNP